MSYSLDFKKKVVDEYNNGKTITELSDKYNIAPSTVFFWKKYFENNNRYTSYPKSDTYTCSELTQKIKKLLEHNKKLEEKVLLLEKKVNEILSINNKISSLLSKQDSDN